jgi:hypothetical protein
LQSEAAVPFGSSTAVLEGKIVVLKNRPFQGDVQVAQIDSEHFVLTMPNEQSNSDPIYSGQTAITLHELFREVRLEFASMNCNSDQVALGAAHIAALQVLARENAARHPMGR